MKTPKTKNWIIYGILALLLVFFIGSQVSSMGQEATQPDALTTSDFTSAVEDNRVTEVTYNAASGSLTGYYRTSEQGAEEEPHAFTATYVGEDTLNELMASHPSISYDIVISDPNFWTNILWYAIPLIAFAVLIFFVFNQFNQANKNFGASSVYVTIHPTYTSFLQVVTEAHRSAFGEQIVVSVTRHG